MAKTIKCGDTSLLIMSNKVLFIFYKLRRR